jgi:hypothetical protein
MGVDLDDDGGPKGESYSRTRATSVAQLLQGMLARISDAVLCDQETRRLAWRFHIVRDVYYSSHPRTQLPLHAHRLA